MQRKGKRLYILGILCILLGSIVTYAVLDKKYKTALEKEDSRYEQEVKLLLDEYVAEIDSINRRAYLNEREIRAERMAVVFSGHDRQAPYLEEEDEKFLETYVYGRWQFTERVFMLDESENNYYDTRFNLSDEGVEEMKGIVLELDREYVCFDEEYSFTDQEDFYLFAGSGGFAAVRYPMWGLEEGSPREIELHDGRHWYEIYEYDVRKEIEANELVHVFYKIDSDLGVKKPCDSIYVNPAEPDTLYVDFCGLWKLERCTDL